MPPVCWARYSWLWHHYENNRLSETHNDYTTIIICEYAACCWVFDEVCWFFTWLFSFRRSEPTTTTTEEPTTTTTEPVVITECGSILSVSPPDAPVVSGWGPSCYISRVNGTAYLNTQCRDLIQRLPPDIGNININICSIEIKWDGKTRKYDTITRRGEYE